MKPIKLFILTGFLGSGKTTLLRKILNEDTCDKRGVLMNEFGKIGIDGTIIADEGIKLTEINNGSIFCACLKDSFDDALAALLATDIDSLYIESSGLADPIGIERILSDLKGRLKRSYEIMSLVCVADASTVEGISAGLETAMRQLLISDVVILNKADKAADDIERLTIWIEKINPIAKVLPAKYCDIDLDSLVNAHRTDGAADGESINDESDRAPTHILRAKGSFEQNNFIEFLNEFAGLTYRIKGFFTIDNHGVHVDYVGDSVSVLRLKKTVEKNMLVIIVRQDTENITRLIRNAWESRFSERLLIA